MIGCSIFFGIFPMHFYNVVRSTANTTHNQMVRKISGARRRRSELDRVRSKVMTGYGNSPVVFWVTTGATWLIRSNIGTTVERTTL